jgi:hypothetical protein
MMMRLLKLLILLNLVSFNCKADDLQGAARDLGQYYYKGSRVEESLNAIQRKLPIEIQTTFKYFAPLQQVFIEQRISIVITFP